MLVTDIEHEEILSDFEENVEGELELENLDLDEIDSEDEVRFRAVTRKISNKKSNKT